MCLTINSPHYVGIFVHICSKPPQSQTIIQLTSWRLEEIRDKFTEWFVHRKKEADKWKGKVSSYVNEELINFLKG